MRCWELSQDEISRMPAVLADAFIAVGGYGDFVAEVLPQETRKRLGKETILNDQEYVPQEKPPSLCHSGWRILAVR